MYAPPAFIGDDEQTLAEFEYVPSKAGCSFSWSQLPSKSDQYRVEGFVHRERVLND